jgi:two-component system OmpR family response regulator
MAKQTKQAKKVRIFSALEVANICGVVNQTTINWIKNNHLKAFTTPGGQYRIYAEDLLQFLESRGMRIPEELQEIVNEEKKCLVIVDDDRELNQMMFSYFKTKFSSYEIFQAFDGFEAGSLISKHEPDGIVLDLDLPGLNGFDLCKKIRESSDSQSLKIISISGMDTDEVRQKILSNGANAFFSKPLQLEELYQAIMELV